MKSTTFTSILKNAMTALFCAALLSLVAFAQETSGNIEGTVSDASGARVPNATVKVEGSAFSRTTTSGGDGFFRVLQVPPGIYKVTVGANNFSNAVAEAVTVALGKTTELTLSLKAGSIQDVVTITGDEVARLDPADSKIQTNITSKVIESLPKGTNMTSLLKLSPAARPEANSGGFQVDGASGSENSFIIDGQEVSNFRTGVLNTNNNLPFAFVQEIQIKTSGFEAQYGGATGGVINVVTKGGSNEFHGLGGIEFEPNQLWAGPRPILNAFRTGTGVNFVQINEYLKPKKDDFKNLYPSFAIGGPIKKDRLWFFTSYAPQIFDTNRTTQYFTSDPRTRTQNAQQAYHTKVRQEYWQSRIDASPVDSLRLTATYTWNPIVQSGVLPAGQISLGGVIPSVNFGGATGVLTGNGLTNKQGGRQNSANVSTQAVWSPTSSLIASFRFSRGFLNEKLNSYFIPQQTRFRCVNLAPSATSGAGCGLGFDSIPNNTNVNFDVSVRYYFSNAWI